MYQNVLIHQLNIMEIEKLKNVNLYVHNFYMVILLQIYVDNQHNVKQVSLLMILEIYVLEHVLYYNKLMDNQHQEDV